jgi:hypothetical protein
MDAVLRIDSALVDRLRTFGKGGMSDAAILEWLMDEAERHAFVGEVQREMDAVQRWKPLD